jgi:hypothetical protein
MLEGIEVLEEDRRIDEASLVDTWNLSGLITDAPKLQILRRELREIRELLA